MGEPPRELSLPKMILYLKHTPHFFFAEVFCYNLYYHYKYSIYAMTCPVLVIKLSLVILVTDPCWFHIMRKEKMANVKQGLRQGGSDGFLLFMHSAEKGPEENCNIKSKTQGMTSSKKYPIRSIFTKRQNVLCMWNGFLTWSKWTCKHQSALQLKLATPGFGDWDWKNFSYFEALYF